VTRLRARVRTVNGATKHLQAVQIPGAVDIVGLPDPIEVEAVEENGAVYLLCLDASGNCIADTWHESVEAARAQANFEFAIDERDWREVG
jgi:hypothetical protein